MEVEELNKGGETWLQLTMSRTAQGLEIWVKALPRLEEFITSISGPSDNLAAYGISWRPLNPVEILKLRGPQDPLEDANYTINAPCANLLTMPQGKRIEVPNLSFLRFEGIGSPEGVKFIIIGPVSKQYVRAASRKILEASRQLIIDYIAPMNVSMQISSQEL